MPPTLPYWPLEGPFEGKERATKHLLFSAWNMVADVVSAVLTQGAFWRLFNQPAVIALLRQRAPAAAPRRVSGQLMAATAGLFRQVAPAAAARDESAYWSFVLR